MAPGTSRNLPSTSPRAVPYRQKPVQKPIIHPSGHCTAIRSGPQNPLRPPAPLLKRGALARLQLGDQVRSFSPIDYRPTVEPHMRRERQSLLDVNSSIILARSASEVSFHEHCHNNIEEPHRFTTKLGNGLPPCRVAKGAVHSSPSGPPIDFHL